MLSILKTMFKTVFENKFLSLFFSIVSHPLELWLVSGELKKKKKKLLKFYFSPMI